MKLFNIFDNLYVKMDKAKATHKYYKRVPKPTGKGYIYYYTKEQYQASKKEDKKGLFSGIMSFFGFKDDKQAKEKVTEIYTANKSELSGIDKSTFSDYLNEYLSNKDKWDKKFQGKEKVIGTKDGKKVVKKQPAEKKAPGKKGFSLSIMKKVAGVVSGESRREGAGTKNEQTDIGVGDNFATMPEGEGILNKKVTGSLFKNHTWKQFIEDDIDYFLNKFNKPLNFENRSSTLSDNVSKNFGKDDISELKDLIKKYPDGQISVIVSEGSRKLKTKIPKELNNSILSDESQPDKREIMSHEGEKDIYSSDNLKKPDGSYKNTIPHKGIKKSNIKDPLEKKLFDTIKVSNQINDSMSKIKPLFSYSKEGQDAGVWTDTRVMILDKEITDEIYNTNKQREFLTEKRKNPAKSEKEIIKEIDEKTKAGKFPNYKQVIPSEDKISKTGASFTGTYKSDIPAKPMEYTDGETTVYLNADFIATLKSRFPDATIHLSGPMSPAVFKFGNDIKAILMPIQKKSEWDMKKLEKSSKILKLNGKYYRMDKAKKMPIGTVNSKGYKKVAEGKWVKEGAGKPGKKEDKSKKDGKPDDKKKKEPTTDENSVKERVKTALKKMANILAEALSGKDVVQPTGSAVEQAGEDIKRKKKQVKPEDKPKEKPKADKPTPLKKARDLSKLTRKVITDKRGHRRTVWVRTGKKEVKKEKKKINQTETKEFKDWFGDSKVVDKNGNPLVVYHGTDRKLTVIEPGYDEPGAWFTSDQKNASNYAKGLDAKIYDVYLKAEKPLNVPFEWNGEEMVPEIKGLDEDEMEELGLDNNVSIVKYAKSNGYDSVNFPNGNFSESGETWVVFDSSQIKSATDNRGTFDPESGEMNKAIR